MRGGDRRLAAAEGCHTFSPASALRLGVLGHADGAEAAGPVAEASGRSLSGRARSRLPPGRSISTEDVIGTVSVGDELEDVAVRRRGRRPFIGALTAPSPCRPDDAHTG